MRHAKTNDILGYLDAPGDVIKRRTGLWVEMTRASGKNRAPNARIGCLAQPHEYPRYQCPLLSCFLSVPPSQVPKWTQTAFFVFRLSV